MQKKYQFAVIATDVVIFTMTKNGLEVLLIQMKKAPYQGFWAVPGGLVGGQESVDAAAERILKEKTGVAPEHLEQLYTFGKVNRDPFGRVVSVAYFSIMPSNKIKLHTTAEYNQVAWYNINKLPSLAYDHKEIIQTALNRLKAKLGYTNIVYTLLPGEFTLSQLQSVYENILGKKMDKRNFRKKILSLGLIKKTGKKRTGQASRPAVLYHFSHKNLKRVEML